MSENFRIKGACKCGSPADFFTHRNNELVVATGSGNTAISCNSPSFCQPFESVDNTNTTITNCLFSTAVPVPAPPPLCPDNGKLPNTERCNCGDGALIQYCDQGLYCTHQNFWTIPTLVNKTARIGQYDGDDFRGAYCPSAPLWFLGDDDCFYCTKAPLPRGIWSGQIGVWLLVCVASTVVSFILSMLVSLIHVDDTYGREACKFTEYNRRIPGCHPFGSGGCDGAIYFPEKETDGRMKSCIPVDTGYNLPEVVAYCCCLPGCLVCGTCCCVLPALFRCCWENCLSMKSARRQRRHERREAKKQMKKEKIDEDRPTRPTVNNTTGNSKHHQMENQDGVEMVQQDSSSIAVAIQMPTNTHK